MATITNSICTNNKEIDIQSQGGALKIATTANATSVSIGNTTAATSITLSVGSGGLNIPSFTTTGALVSNASGVITDANANTAGYVLTSNGSGSVPTFQAASSGGISTIDGNTGSITGSTVTISGSGPISTSGTSATMTITTTAANTANADIGSATASSNAFTFTGGAGISTSATCSVITITSSGASGFLWVNTTTSTQAMIATHGYVSNNGASLVTFTLPSTGTIGDQVGVLGNGSGGWTIAQNSGQTIHFNAVSSTTGVTGGVSSTGQYDSLTLICTVTNTDWVAFQPTGNLSVV